MIHPISIVSGLQLILAIFTKEQEATYNDMSSFSRKQVYDLFSSFHFPMKWDTNTGQGYVTFDVKQLITKESTIIQEVVFWSEEPFHFKPYDVTFNGDTNVSYSDKHYFECMLLNAKIEESEVFH